jgi:hypothetical protein
LFEVDTWTGDDNDDSDVSLAFDADDGSCVPALCVEDGIIDVPRGVECIFDALWGEKCAIRGGDWVYSKELESLQALAWLRVGWVGAGTAWGVGWGRVGWVVEGDEEEVGW